MNVNGVQNKTTQHKRKTTGEWINYDNFPFWVEYPFNSDIILIVICNNMQNTDIKIHYIQISGHRVQ